MVARTNHGHLPERCATGRLGDLHGGRPVFGRMLPCKQVPLPMKDRSSCLLGWQPHHCRMPSSLQIVMYVIYYVLILVLTLCVTTHYIFILRNSVPPNECLQYSACNLVPGNQCVRIVHVQHFNPMVMEHHGKLTS